MLLLFKVCVFVCDIFRKEEKRKRNEKSSFASKKHIVYKFFSGLLCLVFIFCDFLPEHVLPDIFLSECFCFAHVMRWKRKMLHRVKAFCAQISHTNEIKRKKKFQTNERIEWTRKKLPCRTSKFDFRFANIVIQVKSDEKGKTIYWMSFFFLIYGRKSK